MIENAKKNLVVPKVMFTELSPTGFYKISFKKVRQKPAFATDHILVEQISLNHSQELQYCYCLRPSFDESWMQVDETSRKLTSQKNYKYFLTTGRESSISANKNGFILVVEYDCNLSEQDVLWSLIHLHKNYEKKHVLRYEFTNDLRVILLWKSFIYNWIDIESLHKHYKTEQMEYQRLILGFNNFLRKSGLINCRWPRIGDFLDAKDENKERKLRLYAEYLFASTNLDFRNNPLMPNRDSDTVSNMKKKCKLFQTELRTLSKKKSNILTKKMNQEQLKLHRSSLSTDILNYRSKLFTFFNNRYDSAIAEYIHELEPGKSPITELEPNGFSFTSDETNQTADLLYKLVLGESQRQPSSCPSHRSSYPASPSLHAIGPPKTSSTPCIQPCIQNVEIAKPSKKRNRVDSDNVNVGMSSSSTLASSSKKQTVRNTFARKTITHLTHNNASGFASKNTEDNHNSENSDQTDFDQSTDGGDSYVDDVERVSLNWEDFESSDSDEEPYSPTTREKRLQYSIDKDYRPEDEDQSSRILTDLESIDDILQKALKHQCRPINNFGTRRQSQSVKPTPVIQIHRKPNPQTKGINLKVQCKTCDEIVYTNSSMLNERFLIKNTACRVSGQGVPPTGGAPLGVPLGYPLRCYFMGFFHFQGSIQVDFFFKKPHDYTIFNAFDPYQIVHYVIFASDWLFRMKLIFHPKIGQFQK